jgi:hypothetical protein
MTRPLRLLIKIASVMTVLSFIGVMIGTKGSEEAFCATYYVWGMVFIYWLCD